MRLAIEVVGWCGAVLLLSAYGLLSAGRLREESLLYHFMNILGGAGFVVNSGWNGAFPSAAMNLIWMGIGITAVVQHHRRVRVKVDRAS